MALIFTFHNQTVLRRFSEPESGNQSPNWACFLSCYMPVIPNFSDVIAIEGHHGHLQAVSLKTQPEICVKIGCP